MKKTQYEKDLIIENIATRIEEGEMVSKKEHTIYERYCDKTQKEVEKMSIDEFLKIIYSMCEPAFKDDGCYDCSFNVEDDNTNLCFCSLGCRIGEDECGLDEETFIEKAKTFRKGAIKNKKDIKGITDFSKIKR